MVWPKKPGWKVVKSLVVLGKEMAAMILMPLHNDFLLFTKNGAGHYDHPLSQK